MELPLDVASLCATLRAHGVGFALVFGSWATGRGGEDSDVDLAIWAAHPLDGWRLRGELPDVVDLLDLRTVPDGVAGRVAMEGLVLLDDDPVARVRWQADMRKRYLDEAHRRETFRRDFVQAHGGSSRDARP